MVIFLKQVWINLLDNGIKFSPEFGKLSVSLHTKDGTCIVKVQDHGPGMDPNAFIQAIIRNGQIGSAVQEVGRSKGLLSGMRAVTFKSEGETLDLSAFLGEAAEDEESESVEAASAAAAVADELASDEK